MCVLVKIFNRQLVEFFINFFAEVERHLLRNAGHDKALYVAKERAKQIKPDQQQNRLSDGIEVNFRSM